MTAGHRHRTLTVQEGGFWDKVLRRPTLRVVGEERAERSRFVYGPVNGKPGRWRLTPLGMLHSLIGLTLNVIPRAVRPESVVMSKRFWLDSGVFHDWRQHHRRWLSVFRAGSTVEVWFGNRWITISWER